MYKLYKWHALVSNNLQEVRNTPCQTTVGDCVGIDMSSGKMASLTVEQCQTVDGHIQLTNEQGSTSKMLQNNVSFQRLYHLQIARNQPDLAQATR